MILLIKRLDLRALSHSRSTPPYLVPIAGCFQVPNSAGALVDRGSNL